MAELTARERVILYAAVSEYVQTGEPVGSRTLSKRGIDLSPATIRAVLADLEDQGYLLQPHTSAGRIPTDRALRLYVDALMEIRELSSADHARIRARFDQMSQGESALRETGRLLSELTGAAAVVVAPRAESMTLQHLRFIRTRPGEVLAVMVMADGTVQNRFLPAEVDEDELLRIHNLLDDVIEGRSLGDLRELFERRVKSERVQADQLRKTAFELGGAALAAAAAHADRSAEVVIEGRGRLLEQHVLVSNESMRQIMNMLDDVDTLVRLLDATALAHKTAVFLGREENGQTDLAVISAAYRRGGQPQGAIGVIGPSRMDYPKVVPLVSATATAMSAMYERDRRNSLASDDDD